MIIYSGLGGLVPLVTILYFLLYALLGLNKSLDGNVYMSSALALNGTSLWFLGRWLSKKSGSDLNHLPNWKQAILRSKHTMFFIKVEYWGVISFLLSLLYWAR